MFMEEIDLKDFFRYYLSNLMYVVFAMIIVLSLGDAYNLWTRDPLYQSNVTIILASKANENASYTVSDVTLNKNLTKTYSNIVKSRKVLNQVIKENKLDYSLNQLNNMISVTNEADTEIIKIIVSSKDSKEAAYIANAIVDPFTEEVKRIYDINNVSVVDEAIEADSPYNIHIAKESVIFALIGAILASGVLFVCYYFDTTVKSADQIEEKFKLNVIGRVPEVDKE